MSSPFTKWSSFGIQPTHVNPVPRPYGTGVYGVGIYGTGVVPGLPSASSPVWYTVSSTSGNFSKVSVAQSSTVAEVAFDEGGFGEGGFDPLQINYPGSSSPNWIVETVK